MKKTVPLLVSLFFMASILFPRGVGAGMSHYVSSLCLSSKQNPDDVTDDVKKKRKFPDHLFEGFSKDQKKALIWAYDYARSKQEKRDDEDKNFATIVFLKRLRELEDKTDLKFDHSVCMMAMLITKVMKSERTPAEELKDLKTALNAAIRSKGPLKNVFNKDDIAYLMVLMENFISINNYPSIRYVPDRHVVQNFMDAIIQGAGELDVLVLFFIKEIYEGDLRRDMKKELPNTAVKGIDKEIEYLHYYYEHVYAPLAERLGLDVIAADIREKLFVNKIRIEDPEGYNKIMHYYSDILSKRYPRPLEKIFGLYGGEYFRIKRDVQEKMVKDYTKEIHSILEEKGIKNVKIEVRVKSGYSLYKKMLKKDGNLTLISDLVGIRLIAPTRDKMYEYVQDVSAELGAWNTNIKAEERIEIKDQYSVGIDFINESVLDKYSIPVEVQSIDFVGNFLYHSSPSAHWIYKAEQINKNKDGGEDQVFEPDPFIFNRDSGEKFKSVYDALSKWVYVFTAESSSSSSKGYSRHQYRTIRLPAGAIHVDFASAGNIDGLQKGYAGIATESSLNVEKIFSPEGMMILARPIQKKNELQPLMTGEYVAFIKNGSGGSLSKVIKRPKDILNKAKKVRARYLLTKEFSKTTVSDAAIRKIVRNNFDALLHESGHRFPEYIMNNPSADQEQFMQFLMPLLGLREVKEIYESIGYGVLDIDQITTMYRGRLLLAESKGGAVNIVDLIKKRTLTDKRQITKKKKLYLAVDLLKMKDFLGLLEEIGSEAEGTITVQAVKKLMKRPELWLAKKHKDDEIAFLIAA